MLIDLPDDPVYSFGDHGDYDKVLEVRANFGDAQNDMGADDSVFDGCLGLAITASVLQFVGFQK